MKQTLAKYCALLALVLTLGTACSSGSKQTAYISQLLFNETITNAYLGGSPFTGKAWSDDGHTICLTCQEGSIKFVEVYHQNGNVAMRNTSLVGAGQCFDESGQPIGIEDFVELYPTVTQSIQSMVDNMLCSPELK